MTALNNERLRRANQVTAVAKILERYMLTPGVALALAEMVEGDAPPEAIAREILRKDSTELLDLFLRYNGIYGFTQLILNAKANIDSLRRPVGRTEKREGDVELTSAGFVTHGRQQ